MVVRDGVVLVGKGVAGPVEADVFEGVDFDSKGEVSEGVDFDSEGKVSDDEVIAVELAGDEAALSVLWTNADEDEELSALLASLLFFAARIPPTPPPTAPTTTIAIITVRNIQKDRGARPQMRRFGGGGGDGTFFSR